MSQLMDNKMFRITSLNANKTDAEFQIHLYFLIKILIQISAVAT
jgi:hypothetical protein